MRQSCVESAADDMTYRVFIPCGWRSLSFPPHDMEVWMSEPRIAQASPYAVEVEQGKNYWWCACGLSANQPFCDGSHKSTSFTPVRYTAETSKTVYFCGCKRSSGVPLCDGTHRSLQASAGGDAPAGA